MTNEVWVGTYHGRHDFTQATVTATRDDTHREPYAWTCTCGDFQRFSTQYGMDRSAWRHTHPTRVDQLRQWAARLFQTRNTS
ncbi:hypothetical protein [Streptomyces noursei]|uniref:hypothetical protein n=1 Tax=Streptomyces noursei TaxID=1971 RepID=UPI00167A4C41|nr:hypothetical protein [Streptomyces noursei]MCZ1021222.1 hypothetical protein [Streptomyces noursei]GGX53025.1 hypothetical protein GCM10010341_87900 [Streptomyces noursei]